MTLLLDANEAESAALPLAAAVDEDSANGRSGDSGKHYRLGEQLIGADLLAPGELELALEH